MCDRTTQIRGKEHRARLQIYLLVYRRKICQL